MYRSVCLALALGLGSPALAAGSALPSPDEIAKHDMMTIGAGVAFIPDYEGSNDYRLIPVAAVRAKLGGISFSTRGTYLYAGLLSGGRKVDFDLGPIVGARISDRRHVDDPVIKLLPHRKTAIEVGGYAGVNFHGLTNSYDTLGVRLEVVHDIGKAHKSTVFGPNVEFSTPLSRKTYASLSAGMEFVSNKFADYYFSINPADSLASGLPVFKAGGGLKNWKLGLLLNQSLSGNLMHGLSIFGAGQYSRLVGDFKRSPIVSERGNAGQWLGAVGLAYTW